MAQARKACPENFNEKVTETVIGGSVGKGYDFSIDLFFDFKKALTILTKFSSLLMRIMLPEVLDLTL